MRKLVHTIGFLISMALLLPLFLGSCATSRKNYKREYSKVWKETIQSEAWKISIEEANAKPRAREHFYTSSEKTDPGIVEGEPYTNRSAVFAEKYDLLVTRAYFKIISEAEVADSRLKAEYITQSAQAQEIQHARNKTAQQHLRGTRRKYEAHREMLEGLKSWNILSEYGSDDLQFFMAENRERVLQMYQDGQPDERIIYYLVYKLADLYHFDE